MLSVHRVHLGIGLMISVKPEIHDPNCSDATVRVGPLTEGVTSPFHERKPVLGSLGNLPLGGAGANHPMNFYAQVEV